MHAKDIKWDASLMKSPVVGICYRTYDKCITCSNRTFCGKMSDSMADGQGILKSDRTMTDGRRQSESLLTLLDLQQNLPKNLPKPVIQIQLVS